MNPIFALAGNPNCGKTTLFNALTGSHQTVGNWPGVTVEKRSAVFAIDGKTIELVDLPGTYSLTPYSLEEQVTRDYLLARKMTAVINVVDATALERGLFFTLSLLNEGIRVIVALNLMDELDRDGGSINTDILSKELSCPVVPISARQRTGFTELFQQIVRSFDGQATTPSPLSPLSEEETYARIAQILNAAAYNKRRAGTSSASERLDRVLTGRFTALPLLVCALLAVFYLAFGAPGKALTQLAEQAVSRILLFFALLCQPLPAWMRSLILDGALAGAGSVLCFLPQVLILYFFMAIIEDTGYMARAAYITDRLFRHLGLSGRSVIPLIMGLGCTTAAAGAVRGVENERDRQLTAMLLPCISCGAKLPVYSLFARAFFPGREAPVILSLYAFGIFALALEGKFLSRLLFREDDSPFILELPAYRLPVWASVARRLGQRAGDFVKRAGSVIVLMSVVFWFMRYFSPAFSPALSMNESLLAAVSAWIAPLFAAMGFGSWQAVSALISGFAAKECIISSFQVMFLCPDQTSLVANLSAAFSGAAGAYAYLLFILLAPPCVSALAALKREIRSRRAMALMLGTETGAAALAAAAAFLLFG